MEPNRPKPWKMALLSWVCIYPLINLIYVTVMPRLADWPTPLRTLLVTLILAPAMSALMGLLQHRLGAWVRR